MLDNGIHTLAYFYKDSVTSCKEIKKIIIKKKRLKKIVIKKIVIIQKDYDKKDCDKKDCDNWKKITWVIRWI